MSGSRSCGRPGWTPSIGSVKRYWWAIGMIGTVDADHPADLGGEHAAGVDDDVGADLGPLARLLDGHAGHSATFRADRDDPRLRADLRAALARAGGQRVGQPGRIQPAVGRQPDGAEDAVGRHQREAVLRLLRRDEIERQAERLGPARLAPKLLEPLRRRRQAKRPDLVPRRVRARLGGQAPVEVGAVHHHLGERHRAPELADQARRVEGRSGGQFGAFDEDDVGPAALGEVVGDARPADPAADDDGPRVFHPRSVAARVSASERVRARRCPLGLRQRRPTGRSFGDGLQAGARPPRAVASMEPAGSVAPVRSCRRSCHGCPSRPRPRSVRPAPA